MYDNQQIQDEFIGLVGLRQNDNPDFEQLSSDLIKTSTNVLIQHPLLNIENLDMTARNYGFFNFSAWSAVTTYADAARVKVATVVYESQQAANLNHAVTDTDWWLPVSLLSLYLEDVFRNSIDEVLNSFVNEKKLRREAKTLLDNVILYEGQGSRNDLIVNQGALVGFAISVKHSRNLVALIKRIGHQFTQAGTLKLFLYHSSQEECIQVITITMTDIYNFDWSDQAITLRHVAATYDAGGTFFLMYDQDDIPGQAINKNQSWGTAPCYGCNGFNTRAWNLYSKYFTIRACRITAANRNLATGSDDSEPDTMWDINNTEFVQNTNWGLNLELMAKCDLTEILIQHKDSFAFAIRDMVTVKLLEGLANSTRQNVAESIVSKQAMIALQVKSVGGGGLREAAEKQIKAIDFEFSNLNDYCLPCNNARGLNYGAAGLQ